MSSYVLRCVVGGYLLNASNMSRTCKSNVTTCPRIVLGISSFQSTSPCFHFVASARVFDALDPLGGGAFFLPLFFSSLVADERENLAPNSSATLLHLLLSYPRSYSRLSLASDPSPEPEM